MCKKMAHSEQLNIKVDPPFSVGCRCFWLSVFLASLHLSGCRLFCRPSGGGLHPVGRASSIGLPVGLVGGAVGSVAGLGFLSSYLDAI